VSIWAGYINNGARRELIACNGGHLKFSFGRIFVWNFGEDEEYLENYLKLKISPGKSRIEKIIGLSEIKILKDLRNIGDPLQGFKNEHYLGAITVVAV